MKQKPNLIKHIFVLYVSREIYVQPSRNETKTKISIYNLSMMDG